jgi:hypothetical protein
MSKRPKRKQQLRAIAEARGATEMAVGQSMFLVPTPWLKSWDDYCHGRGAGTSPERPLPSATLLGERPAHCAGILPVLKPHMVEGLHYEVIPEGAWKLLSAWYGGVPVSRPVIQERDGSMCIEPYPALMQVWQTMRQPGTVSCFASRYALVGELKEVAATFHGLDPVKLRLWKMRDMGSAEAELDDAASLLAAKVIPRCDTVGPVQVPTVHLREWSAAVQVRAPRKI